MPDCYYTCNLLPLELAARAGYTPRWLGGRLRSAGAAARRDALTVHPMTCPYVTKLVAAAEDLLNGNGRPSHADCVVVPGGCDAARRMGDLLTATYPDQVYMLHVPRSASDGAAKQLANGLERLDGWLRDRLTNGASAPASGDGAHAAPTHATPASASPDGAEPPAVDYPRPPRPRGVFVVSGPLTDDSLLGLIDRLGAHVSGLESCTSPDRWRPLAASTAEDAAADTAAGAALGAAGNDGAHYQELAARVFDVGVCPRRSTEDRLAYLQKRLDEAAPSSVIYARQSFCDPGAYDALLVADLARERGLPYLEIEVDFPFDANGPLRVRVEAFLEAQLMDEDLLASDDLFDEV